MCLALGGRESLSAPLFRSFLGLGENTRRWETSSERHTRGPCHLLWWARLPRGAGEQGTGPQKAVDASEWEQPVGGSRLGLEAWG